MRVVFVWFVTPEAAKHRPGEAEKTRFWVFNLSSFRQSFFQTSWRSNSSFEAKFLKQCLKKSFLTLETKRRTKYVNSTVKLWHVLTFVMLKYIFKTIFVLYYIVLYYIILIILYYTVLYYVILIILYYIILYYTILYYIQCHLYLSVLSFLCFSSNSVSSASWTYWNKSVMVFMHHFNFN